VPDPTTIWLANNIGWLHMSCGPPASASAVRHEIAAVGPAVSASFVRSMDQWIGGTLAPRRFNLQLESAYAAAPRLLAIVGSTQFPRSPWRPVRARSAFARRLAHRGAR
jgi:hypothetical protein